MWPHRNKPSFYKSCCILCTIRNLKKIMGTYISIQFASLCMYGSENWLNGLRAKFPKLLNSITRNKIIITIATRNCRILVKILSDEIDIFFFNNPFYILTCKYIVSLLPEICSKFHSGRNEMTISARMKCDSSHLGQNEMEFISFRPEWNGHLILAKMKCHF